MAYTTKTRFLTAEVEKAVRENLRIKNRLALQLDISSNTVFRYLNQKSIMLTSALALDIISEELGIDKELLLTEK